MTAARGRILSVRIAKLAAATATQAEQERRLPSAVVDELKKEGYLRLTVPARYGGLALDLPDLLDELAFLARGNASLGWNVMVWAQSQITLARLPPATYERVLSQGPDVVVAATSAGSGSAVEAGGGLVVNGRWAFASGCDDCTWALVHCAVPHGAVQRSVGVLVPRLSCEIEDVWQVLGLRATGSKTIRVENAQVSWSHVYELDGPAANRATPHSALPVRAAFALHMGAVAVGNAEGALDEILEDVSARPGHYERARQEGDLHLGLGSIRSELDSARGALGARAEAAWQTALQGRPLDARSACALAAAGTQSVRAASNAALWSFTLAGSAALFDSHPLQRRLRDALAIAQHANVTARNLAALGREILAVRETPC